MAPTPPHRQPTLRQAEVLCAYIAAGSIAAAAYELGISESTARQHLSGLMGLDRAERGASRISAGYESARRRDAATPREESGS